MPNGWHDGEGELFLLALFRQGLVIGAPNGISAVPTELTAGEPLFDLLAPREHLILAVPRPGGVAVQLVLFGELRYTLGIKTDILPATGHAWLCDPTETRVTRFNSIDALFEALFERQLLFGPTTDMRRERPERG